MEDCEGVSFQLSRRAGIVVKMASRPPHDLLAAVEASFEKFGIPPDAPLVAAVSGGPDSMALLDVLARSPQRRKRMRVGHVDHGLRPESAAEAAFVEEECRKRDVPFFSTRLSLPLAGENLAARLRKARYEFLHSLVPGSGYLLTAHHADDQAVTMLMRLIEGAALPGLGGIRPLRGNVVRPFLGIGRRRLLDWLAIHGVPYCTDPSNEDTGKFRNRVRNEIWPLVLRERPGAAETLARAAQRLQEDDDALQQWAWQLAEAVTAAASWVEVPLHALDAPPAVLRRLLALILVEHWGIAPPDGSQWAEVQTSLKTGRRANLPGRTTVQRTATGLLLLREGSQPDSPPLDIADSGDYILPMGTLAVRKLLHPVKVRALQAGDRLGDGKRVVDVLAARGLPRHRRAGYPVVCDPESGQIFCAPPPEPAPVAGVGEFAFTPHSIQGFTGRKVMAPQIVKGANGTL